MNKVFFFVGVFFLWGQARAAISLSTTTQVSTSYAAGGTKVITVPSSTSGTLHVVGVGCDSTAFAVSGVTDDQGGTWHDSGIDVTGTAFGRLNIWYSYNSPAGVTSITIATGAGGGGNGVIIRYFEYSSVKATADPKDQTGSTHATSNPNFSGPSLTPSEANELFLAVSYSGGAAINSVSAPFTFLSNTGVGNNFGNAYYVNSAATAQQATWTEGSNYDSICGMVTFKAAPASTNPTTMELVF